MKYKELIDLGFKHIEDSDPQWLNEYGYEYFHVEYKLDKRHCIDWDVQKQTCRLMKFEKDGFSIMEQWVINDLELLKNIIRIFGKKKDAAVKEPVTSGHIHYA
jgi:site-specific recombinase